MAVMHPLSKHALMFYRAEDGLYLGDLWLHHASETRAYRNARNVSEPDRQQVQRFATLDAAVSWIESCPGLPDIRQYPVHHGVYGPVLATWPGYTLIACVETSGAKVAGGLGNEACLKSSAFLVVSDMGRVCARLTHANGQWTVLVATPFGSANIRAVREHFRDAFQVLCSEVAGHLIHASRHAAMHFLAQQDPALPALAEALLPRRAAWQSAIRSGADASPPWRSRMIDSVKGPLFLHREPDSFRLGGITRVEHGYDVALHGILDGASVPRSSTVVSSLDAAIDLLATSPFAPDVAT